MSLHRIFRLCACLLDIIGMCIMLSVFFRKKSRNNYTSAKHLIKTALHALPFGAAGAVCLAAAFSLEGRSPAIPLIGAAVLAVMAIRCAILLRRIRAEEEAEKRKKERKRKGRYR